MKFAKAIVLGMVIVTFFLFSSWKSHEKKNFLNAFVEVSCLALDARNNPKFSTLLKMQKILKKILNKYGFEDIDDLEKSMKKYSNDSDMLSEMRAMEEENCSIGLDNSDDIKWNRTKKYY